MTNLRHGIAATVLLAATFTSVAVNQTPEEVDLAWKPKVGDVTTYQMKSNATVDMGGQKTDVQFSMRMKSTIKSIDGEKVTLEGSADQFKMSMGGQDMGDDVQGGPQGSTTRVMLLNGEFVSQESTGQAMPSSARIEQMNTFYRPKAKVKVGETWDHEIKPDAKRGIVEAKVRYTLEGSEMLGKKKTWRVKVVYAEMVGTKPSSFMGSVWLNAENGEMEKWYAEYQDVSFAEGMPPMNAVTTLTRID